MIATTLVLRLLLEPVPVVPPPAPGLQLQPAPVEDRRSAAWIVAGGAGMAAFGAGIGAVIADAMTRANSHGGRSMGTINLAMIVGAAVGLGPGLLFGNEARKPENELARSVIPILDAGGALALGFGAMQSHGMLN